MNQQWKDGSTEAAILDDISIDEPWALLEEFSQLSRLSGSEDEERAAKYITSKLDEFGVGYQVHHPTTLISLPGPATLKTLGEDGREYRVKTTAFSPNTGGEERTAELVYVPGQQVTSMTELFGEQRNAADIDLAGKVVMTEGLGIAARGFDLAESGAIAALFINPGENIHEGITTTTWGSPDLDSDGRTAPIPILTINNPDGQELISKLSEGKVEVTFSNQVDTGWREIPVIVAEIKGNRQPEDFVLFHGHLDSWHVGIGDNATGDATLLELARVFQKHQDKLDRSLRIAWWSGHSHGRYAGSTWYADAYALDLMANCVSHINCDSPGCRWATVYEGVSWMSEAEGFCQAVIRDVTGQDSSGEGHVLRAGDCSFNNLGITTYFMLSSTMPDDLREEKGYYPVGGCGANIAWHTEDDTMEIADRDNLLRDMKVYATAVFRSLNSPVAPFDYRATVTELSDAVNQYQGAAGEAFDFGESRAALELLRLALNDFYTSLAGGEDAESADLRRANAAQRAIGRTLVSLGYTRDGRFRQDPATAIPTLPDLAVARDLENATEHERHLIINSLVRGQNRLVWETGQAAQIARQAAG
ncbi:MAG: M28 family peptidase [Thermomicrobiales bacterium]